MRTKRLFDTDAYIKNNTAKVLSCKISEREGFEDLFEVITDSTVFSPEGGGQKCDRGFFDEIKVVDVREFDGEIIHFLETSIEEGKQTEQKIDFELRFRRMQNHNAEHLICGLIHRRFGYDNVGFHLSENFDEEGALLAIEAVMDVDGPVDAEALAEIEKEANRAIAEDVSIYALLPSGEEAKNISYRSKMDIAENLRLVVIEGYDVCACCAPCLKSSAQIQLVKIVDHMPHRGGMRLTLKAGLDAVNDYVLLHNDNKASMKTLSCVRGECSDAVLKMSEKLASAHEENVSLKKQITALFKNSLEKEIEECRSDYVLFFADTLDEVQSRTLINETVGLKEKAIIVLFDKKDDSYRFVAGKNASAEISLKELAAKMREGLNARGGGSEQMIQGSVSAEKESIEKFFDQL